MEREKEIFLKQIGLLKQASSLLKDRAIKIEEFEKNRRGYSIGDVERNIAISLFKVKLLRLSKDILDFIASETMRNDNPRVYYFLMPHVRTLMDVYARLVHFLSICNDEKEQALTCIGYQLLTYKAINEEASYGKTLSYYRNFFNQYDFNFPDSFKDFNVDWLKQKGLTFKGKKILLTPDNFKKYSSNSINVFKPQEMYRIYSSFSEFLHGNPYYHKDEPHNEKFWVVGTCLVLLPFIIEIIDIYTLKKINPKDFRIFLLEIKKNKSAFTTLWQEKFAEVIKNRKN